MKKIAILVSQDMMPGAEGLREDAFELTEQMGKISGAFAVNGLEAELVLWRSADERAAEFDAMLPLFVWDYFIGNNAQEFLAEMARASQKTQIFNEFDVLRWNSNKSYLDELEHQGAPVIPAINVDTVTQKKVAQAFEEFDCERLVIKPQVGGGAWRQVLYNKGEAFPSKDELPPSAAILQPFLPSVQSEGEYSFLYFGGQFSHALLKQAAKGDYRIQSLYGGTETQYTPSSHELDTARDILDCLDFTPLYARVDLLRGIDGQLKLIELEMIEPYLYMAFCEGEGADNKAANMLARALLKRIDS